MASSAAQAARARRIDALVDRLIEQNVAVARRPTGEDGDDEDDDPAVGNFKLCKRYCDYHLRVHAYKALSEDEVREEIDELRRRMEAMAQDAKAATLGRKMEALRERWRGGEDEDVGTRVALMLLRLSRRPMTTTLDGMSDGGAVSVGAFDALSSEDAYAFEDASDAAGAFGEAYDDEHDASGASTLSEWSDDDSDDQSDGRDGGNDGLVEGYASEGDDPGFSWRDGLLGDCVPPETSTETKDLGKTASAAPELEYISEIVAQTRQFQSVLRDSNVHRGDERLIASIAAKNLQSETSLVQEALHALRSGSVELDRVTLPHVSCMTLDGALTSIRRMASVLTRLKEMKQTSLALGPTIQAFTQALDSRAQWIKSTLVPLEKRLAGESTIRGQPTLLELRTTVRRLEAKIDALERCALTAFPHEGTPAAEAASHCLTTVYELAVEHQATANIHGFAVTMPIFVDTIQPYLQGLQRWLAFGILDDPAEELFIAKGRAIDDFVGSKEHWLHGHVLRHDIETPCFFREFMLDILDVGRSLELLHHTENETSQKVPTLDVHLIDSFCFHLRKHLSAIHASPETFGGDDASERARALVDGVKVNTSGLNNIFETPTSLVGIRNVNTDVVRDTILSRPTRIVPTRRVRPKTALQGSASTLNAWLDEFLTTQVPSCPISLAVQQSIGVHILKRAKEVQVVLSRSLRDSLDIKKELYALRAVFLGGAGDAAMHFFSAIFGILDDPDKINAKWNSTTLNELLGDAFAADNSGEFPEGRGVQVEIIPEAEENIFSRVVIGTGALEKIASLRYSFDVKWPHNIVIPPSTMAQYNAVAVFLGQLRRAHTAMQSVATARWSEHIRCARGSGMGGAKARHLEPRLRHFITSLRDHVIVRILHVDWDVLMKKIDDAMTLEAIRAAHDEFLQDATKRCLVSPDPTWTLVAEQIRTILAVACEYAACQAGDGAVSEEDAMRLSSAFEEAYGYIERVLQAKLDIGSASTRDVEDLLYAIKL